MSTRERPPPSCAAPQPPGRRSSSTSPCTRRTRRPRRRRGIASLFAGARAPRTPSFDEADVSDKPAYIRNRPTLRPRALATIDSLYLKRLQSLAGRRRRGGEPRGHAQSDRTTREHVIVFASDNGFRLGQHRLVMGKQTAYEEGHSRAAHRAWSRCAGRTHGGAVRRQRRSRADLRGRWEVRRRRPSSMDGPSFRSCDRLFRHRVLATSVPGRALDAATGHARRFDTRAAGRRSGNRSASGTRRSGWPRWRRARRGAWWGAGAGCERHSQFHALRTSSLHLRGVRDRRTRAVRSVARSEPAEQPVRDSGAFVAGLAVIPAQAADQPVRRPPVARPSRDGDDARSTTAMTRTVHPATTHRSN